MSNNAFIYAVLLPAVAAAADAQQQPVLPKVREMTQRLLVLRGQGRRPAASAPSSSRPSATGFASISKRR